MVSSQEISQTAGLYLYIDGQRPRALVNFGRLRSPLGPQTKSLFFLSEVIATPNERGQKNTRRNRPKIVPSAFVHLCSSGTVQTDHYVRLFNFYFSADEVIWSNFNVVVRSSLSPSRWITPNSLEGRSLDSIPNVINVFYLTKWLSATLIGTQISSFCVPIWK